MTQQPSSAPLGEHAPVDVPRPGRFGPFGGRYVPEALIPALEELDEARKKAMVDPGFLGELEHLHRTYTGRPSIVTEVPRFAEHCGGARVILKREDLNHTGSHKINNVLGQALLTKRMGKTRVIAETGAGQHGVATATAAALMGLECRVYMGGVDTERQALNVARMRLLGAEVVPVPTGSATLKDASTRRCATGSPTSHNTHYLLGTVTGPHPFPEMVRDFHRIIGEEARAQVLDLVGRLPDAVIACVGGGSNAMGIFHRFVDDAGVRLIGVEAGGEGIESGRHAARFAASDARGAARRVQLPHAGRGRPDHRVALDLGRPRLPERRARALVPARLRPRGVPLRHRRAGDARRSSCCARPRASSRRSSRPTPWRAPWRSGTELGPDALLLVNLSGRGDKDVHTAARYFGLLDEEDNPQ